MDTNENKDEKSNNTQITKKEHIKIHFPLRLCICIGIVIFLFLAIRVPIAIHNKKTVLTVQTTLDKVLDVNELQTVEYVYNSYAVSYGSDHTIQDYDLYKPVSNAVNACRDNIVKEAELRYKEQLAKFQEEENYSAYSSYKLSDAQSEEFQELQEQIELYKDFLEQEKIYKEKYSDILNKGISAKAIDTVYGLFSKKTAENKKDKQKAFEEDTKKIENEQTKYSKFISLKDSVAVKLFERLYNSCDGNYENFDTWGKFLEESRDAAKKSAKEERYAVAYTGIVVIGIDEKLTFDINHKEKKVIVHLPSIKILDVIVDIPSDLENKSVITRDKKYTSYTNWMKEAYALCRSDLWDKAKNNKSLMYIAKDNAKNAIKAFVQPFLNNINYNLEISED